MIALTKLTSKTRFTSVAARAIGASQTHDRDSILLGAAFAGALSFSLALPPTRLSDDEKSETQKDVRSVPALPIRPSTDSSSADLAKQALDRINAQLKAAKDAAKNTKPPTTSLGVPSAVAAAAAATATALLSSDRKQSATTTDNALSAASVGSHGKPAASRKNGMIPGEKKRERKSGGKKGKTIRTNPVFNQGTDFPGTTAVEGRSSPVFDESLRLADEADIPVEKRERGGRKNVRRLHVGYASKKDNSIITLPVLGACEVKNCKLNCSEVINDQQAQQFFRETYLEIVKNAPYSGKNEGKKYLLGMMRSNRPSKSSDVFRSNRKEIDGATVNCTWCRAIEGLEHGSPHQRTSLNEDGSHACPQWNEAQAYFVRGFVSKKSRFFLPPKAEGQSEIEIHSGVFRKLFGLSSNMYTRLNALRQRGVPPSLMKDGHAKCGGQQRITLEQEADLYNVLMYYPRESTHYSPQTEDNNRKYFYNSSLSLYHFWIQYLKSNDNDDDKRFLAQCKRMKYTPTFINIETKKPSVEAYENDPAGKMLKPSLGYRSACNYYKDYDIKFQRRQCDLCILCHELNTLLRTLDKKGTEWKKTEKRLLKHQAEADKGYKTRAEQKKAAAASDGKHEVIQINFLANPRTPLTNLSDSFYKRILGTSAYIITSTNRTPRTTCYLYDETVAGKGADEVVSLLYMYLENKLPETIEVLDIWSDGTSGQVWNNTMVIFLEQLADPGSKLHRICPNLKRLTLSRNPRGHTYGECDTDGGKMSEKGRSILHDRDQGIVHAVYEKPGDKDYFVYWFDVGKEAGLEMIRPSQADFRNWTALFQAESGLYKKPDRKDCFSGPHAGDWLILQAKHINFGVGEGRDGITREHQGVLFCKNDIFQQKPDEVVIRKQFKVSQGEDATAAFHERRALVETETYFPVRSYLEPLKLKPKKIKDLHHMGCLMAKTKGDFDDHYPPPAGKKRKRGTEDEGDDEDDSEDDEEAEKAEEEANDFIAFYGDSKIMEWQQFDDDEEFHGEELDMEGAFGEVKGETGCRKAFI